MVKPIYRKQSSTSVYFVRNCEILPCDAVALSRSYRQQLVLLWFCSHDFSVTWLCESSTFSCIFVKWTRLTDPKSGVQSIMYYELLPKNLLRSGFPLFSSRKDIAQLLQSDYIPSILRTKYSC